MSLNSWLGTGVTLGLAAGALTLTVRNLHDAVLLRRRAATEPWQIVSEWQAYASIGHRFGPPHAKVAVVTFLDYECEACRNAARRAAALLKRHPKSLTFVVRHFPLAIHPDAAGAARAAECAASLGKFPAFHALLVRAVEPGGSGRRRWLSNASKAGIRDTIGFARCLAASSTTAAIDADLLAAKHLRIAASPIILVNEEMYVGLPWDFERIVERHLKGGPTRE